MAALRIGSPVPSTSRILRSRKKKATVDQNRTPIPSPSEARSRGDDESMTESLAVFSRNSVPEEESSFLSTLRNRRENKESQEPTDSEVQSDETHIFRVPENEEIPRLPTSAAPQTRSDEADVKKRCSQTPSPCQLNEPQNFVCPTFRWRMILWFAVAFLILPGVQHYLWSVHSAVTDRRIRAVSSCVITATFTANILLVRKLASKFPFPCIAIGEMVVEGLVDIQEFGNAYL